MFFSVVGWFLWNVHVSNGFIHISTVFLSFECDWYDAGKQIVKLNYLNELDARKSLYSISLILYNSSTAGLLFSYNDGSFGWSCGDVGYADCCELSGSSSLVAWHGRASTQRCRAGWNGRCDSSRVFGKLAWKLFVGLVECTFEVCVCVFIIKAIVYKHTCWCIV